MGGPIYAEAVGEVRKNISLDDMGIINIKIRKAQGRLIEISDEGASEKTDILVDCLRTIFKDQKKIRIMRPIRRAELRLIDIDQSVDADKSRRQLLRRNRRKV